MNERGPSRLCAERARADISSSTPWTKNPRALAGRLRRAQTFLRTLGIEITFSREGRTGTRMIRVSTSAEDTVSTVSASWSDCQILCPVSVRGLL
jgi:hypothetical protein